MDWRCPKCNSTDLTKVSLAYQEDFTAQTPVSCLSAALVGGNGPDLVVGRATTQASHQSALSKQLRPPAKWSYLKVILVRYGISLRWVDRLLRQHSCDEFLKRVVPSADVLYFDFRSYLCSSGVSRVEAQLYVQEAIC